MPSLPNYIVIIGAPRSGTNMLRNVLVSLPGVCTWPCDEINYIWRHGNAVRADDEFPPQYATPRVQAYIRRAFASLAQSTTASWIVEKTCANSLRVPFVDRILPDARYVFLVRDGRDAVASAMRRWTAPLDWGYIAKKAKYVPVMDLPKYVLSYASNRAHRWLSAERRLGSWGPRFQSMQDLLARASLAEVCAAQWERCVSKARKDLAALEPSRVIQVQYEEFVARPRVELQRLLDWLSIGVPSEAQAAATRKVSDGSVGKWRLDLDEKALSQMAPIIDRQLVELGYESCCSDMLVAEAA